MLIISHVLIYGSPEFRKAVSGRKMAAQWLPPEAAQWLPPEAAQWLPPEAAQWLPPEAAQWLPPEALFTQLWGFTTFDPLGRF